MRAERWAARRRRTGKPHLSHRRDALRRGWNRGHPVPQTGSRSRFRLWLMLISFSHIFVIPLCDSLSLRKLQKLLL